MFVKSFQTIEQVGAKEIELSGRLQSKAAELAAAESAAGAAYLSDDGDDGDGAAGVAGVLRLRTEIEAIQRAIGTLRGKRLEVITASIHDRARHAREAAVKRKAELEALTKKSARLCEQLAEAEGVEGGTFLPNAGQPKSTRLSSEISELGRRAGDLEAASVPDSGVFDTESSDAVLLNDAIVAAVLANESAGPSCAGVRAWLSAAAAAVAPRISTGESLESLPRRVRIVWSAGKIDTAKSYIFCPQLAEKRLSALTGEEIGIDVGSGTFRALAG